MRKKFILPLMALCFGLPVLVTAQTSFNYALAHVGQKSTDSHSLIRTIDSVSALVYYHDNSIHQGVIAKYKLPLIFDKALLPPGCTLNDMRITGDNVYFCGHLDTNAILGHIRLSSIGSSMPMVTLFKVSNSYVTNLFRMAAYDVSGS